MGEFDQLRKSAVPEITELRPTPLKRSLKRIGRAGQRWWEAAILVPPVVEAIPLFTLPFAVLMAVIAEIMAFIMGSTYRSAIALSIIFALIGMHFSITEWGGIETWIVTVFALIGLSVGAFLGLLFGPIFKEMPEHVESHMIKTFETFRKRIKRLNFSGRGGNN